VPCKGPPIRPPFRPSALVSLRNKPPIQGPPFRSICPRKGAQHGPPRHSPFRPVSLKKQKAQPHPAFMLYTRPHPLCIYPPGVYPQNPPHTHGTNRLRKALTIHGIYIVPSLTLPSHFTPSPIKTIQPKLRGYATPKCGRMMKEKGQAAPNSGPKEGETMKSTFSITQLPRKARRRVAHAHTGTRCTIPKAQAPRSSRGYRRGLGRLNARAAWRKARGLPPIPPRPIFRAPRRFGSRFPNAARHRAAAFAERRALSALWRSVQTRPRSPALPRPRPSAPSATAAPSEAPPGEGGEDDTGDDGDPPPTPPPRPTKAKAKRGRPRKRKAFRAWTDTRTFRHRTAKLDAFTAAVQGRRDVLFITLIPNEPPSPEDRGLSRVPVRVQDNLAKLRAALRYRKVAHVLVVGTRNDAGGFFPHFHGLVAGVGRDTLERLAAERGFALDYAEVARDVSASARYIVAAHQKREWDRLEGGRGFYVYLPDGLPPEAAEAEATTTYAPAPAPEAPAPACPPVSLGNNPVQALRSIAAAPPPGPVQIAPGVIVRDVPRFLAATLRDLGHPSPIVRSAAFDHAKAFLAALTNGPPSPSPPIGEGGMGCGA